MDNNSHRKLNCWEFHNCGREKNGLMVDKLGECPVSTAMNHDGTNDGVAGGRVCWMAINTNNRIAGTCLCNGNSCQSCEFYRRVQHEEKAAAQHRFKTPVAG
ncbi:MAG: hypothetical protein J7J98_09010 [candidate division Zixibacteria bacterium]|nr:hypothetical protein [candidate division Zixibacteria bacterium]